MIRLIKTADVAAKLGVTVDRFYRWRPELHAAGFPGPVAPFRNRWSEPAIDAWISRAAVAAAEPGAAPAPSAAAEPPPDDVEGWKSLLLATLPGAA